MSDNQAQELLVAKSALDSRKALVFSELTQINEAISSRSISSNKAEAILRQVSSLETEFRVLSKEIITHNAYCGIDPKFKTHLVSTKDFDTFITLISAITENCIACNRELPTPRLEKINQTVKLPTINLPLFDGNIGAFLKYKALFDSLVHTNDSLSPVQKLQFLLSSTSKEANALVASYEILPENYQTAYEALVSRYANKRRSAAYFIRQFVHYKTLNKGDWQDIPKLLEVHRTAKAGLTALNLENLADTLLFELAYNNCDYRIQESFDRSLPSTVTMPTFNQLLNHLETSARTEELRRDSKIEYQKPFEKTFSTFKPNTRHSYVTQHISTNCFHCNGPHSIYQCDSFRKLSPEERLKCVRTSNHCSNCLGKHNLKDCPSKNKCKTCHKQHHSILHFEKTHKAESSHASFHVNAIPNSVVTKVSSSQQSPAQPDATNCCCVQKVSSNTIKGVLLSTIRCSIRAANGTFLPIRLLLDPGSEANLITANLAKRLQLPVFYDSLTIQGVTKSSTKSQGKVNLQLLSSSLNQDYKCSASILSDICDNLPSIEISPEIRKKFEKMDLADPEFYIKSPVDLLLGAQAYAEMLSTEQPSIVKGEPTAIRTIFGWVLLGAIPTHDVVTPTALSLVSLVTSTSSLENAITRFWEAESILATTVDSSSEDIYCEEQYKISTTRGSTGRYTVRLPFIPGSEPDTLDNRRSALCCLYSLESNISSNPSASTEFHNFMEDYIKSNHMVPATSNSNYLLPYHCVTKESTTTRTRVVFNASAQCRNKVSINSLIYAGPNLQKDLPTLLTTFRLHPIVLTCDIKAMFRQILLHPNDRKYQHILYRPQNEHVIKEFELQTITYGFNCSPWLAQRTLKQLALDESSRFPRACKILQENAYMDDLNFGANCIKEAILLRDELIQLLSAGGFPLRKWSSNNIDALVNLPDSDRETPLRFTQDGPVHKVLGLLWNPTSDNFSYSFLPFSGPCSKRNILGYISRIFDPNGYIAPIVFTAKFFIQRLWLLNLNWDEVLPDAERKEWMTFVTELRFIINFHVPRCLQAENATLRLVGFCDASTKGSACCIYLHITRSTYEPCRGILLKAKSRVAPIKIKTIPKLELNAALMLAQLLTSLTSLKNQLKIESVELFCDSQIVLAWLKRSPLELKTFVAHRVQEIQNLTTDCHWHYIRSELNSADFACRTTSPLKFLNNNLWLSGPIFLQERYENWPTTPWQLPNDLPELKTTVLAVSAPLLIDNFAIKLTRFSNFSRMQRSIAYLLRFIHNCRHPQNKSTGSLSIRELENSLNICIKAFQQEDFATDLEKLKKSPEGKDISCRLKKLSPFINSSGLLCVGGRIQYSCLPYNAKHPIIISKHCHLSKLICDYYHRILLHAGPRTTQAFIQRQYWILGIHSLVRKQVRSCKNCHRLSAKPQLPFMAPLPSSRLENVRAFYRIGLDFAGPISTKDTGLRKSRICKSYIMVIVCHSTKAVYLDLVSDLTTAAFLAAFSRFTSRRSLPIEIFCDNGTNFVGAANYSKECTRFLIKHKEELFTHFSVLNVKWTFNTPLAPHMAGLQEAAVKSCKRLIIRQIGSHILTFEEMSTLLAKIEAVLNSRPLGTLSNDPDDCDYLTPGHFIVGAPMLALPEELIDNATPRQRWKLLQQLSQHFWNRWTHEYVHTLVQRQKWTKGADNLKIDDIVYICDLASLPLSWPIGRICTVHPGKDGIVRTVSVRTTSGLFKRPVAKLIKLPNLQ